MRVSLGIPLLGLVLGALFGAWRSPLFLRQIPLEPEAWGLVSSEGRESELVVEGGALVLEGEEGLQGADQLQLGRLGVLKRVEIDLQEESGPVQLRLINDRGTNLQAYNVMPGMAFSEQVEDPQASGIEVLAQGRSARISRLQVVDERDAQVVGANFYLWGRGTGGFLGAALGLLLATVLSGMFRRAGRRPLVWAAVVLGLPLWVSMASPVAVEAWVQKLYLVRLEPGMLSRWLLLGALVPALTQAVVASGWLGVAQGDRRMPGGWWLLGIAVAAAAARGQVLEAVLLLPWLMAPLWLARRSGLEERAWMIREIPSWAILALLGWQAGLVFSVAWRLVCVASVARSLSGAEARPASAWLGVLLLALPVSVEVGIRSTWLEKAWDAQRLAGLSQDGEDWVSAAPFWTGECGIAEGRLSVAFAGGSSTGGAFQFEGQPDLFFPARVQDSLCATAEEGGGIATYNFGRESADSYTISRSLDRILEISGADLLVLYVGMNDLMTASSPYSRKELEARAEEFGALDGLVGLGARSRLLTGLSLSLRPRPVESGDGLQQNARVPGYATAVPLEDAEENLRRIAAGAAEAGAQVLLVSQLLARDGRADGVGPYFDMEQALAEEVEGLHYLDPRALQDIHTDAALLLDMNHMSVEGHRLLGETLAPVIYSLLSSRPGNQAQ